MLGHPIETLSMLFGPRLSDLEQEAYSAMRAGQLTAAATAFAKLLKRKPKKPAYHYMRGLAAKYLRDWPTSLKHNLLAIELSTEFNEAATWNAAIAATALHDWSQARRLWRACGISLDGHEGPIACDFGTAVVRLNPWGDGETVFVRRIDPVRATILNVPLPDSGHCFGDIVLHDGAVTGYRLSNGQQRVPVFNELARWAPSTYRTFVAFVDCDTEADLDALQAAASPGLGYLEDWTSGVRLICLRCSYGMPHSHEASDNQVWRRERTVGMAAQSRDIAQAALARWSDGAPSRRIHGLESPEHSIEPPTEGHVWWRGADDDEG
jgi:tetratricopeptide (TPR) repeat protein